MLAGVIAGLGAAIASARLMSSLLYDTRPVDPAVFSAAPLMLVLVAAAAVLAPAARASRLNPTAALRHE